MKQEKEELNGQLITAENKQSHLLKHALISNHPTADLRSLKDIDKKLPLKQV